MELVRRVDILDQLAPCPVADARLGRELNPVTPVAAAEEIAAPPRGIAQLEVIDGAGHWPWKDAPNRSWPVIAAFINSTIGRENDERMLYCYSKASWRGSPQRIR
jgi:hypothetical protein